MSDLILNRVICTLDEYKEYFYDEKLSKEHEPFISFLKIWDVDDFGDLPEWIYNGYGWTVTYFDNNLVEIKFLTRNKYPIETIVKFLEKSKAATWYVVEEDVIFVTNFQKTDSGINESVLLVNQDEYSKFLTYNWGDETGVETELSKNMKDCDDFIWYFEQKNSNWKEIEKRNLIAAYSGRASEVYEKNIKLFTED